MWTWHLGTRFNSHVSGRLIVALSDLRSFLSKTLAIYDYMQLKHLKLTTAEGQGKKTHTKALLAFYLQP